VSNYQREDAVRMFQDTFLMTLSQIEQAESVEDLKEIMKGLAETRKIMSTTIYDLSVAMDEHSTRLTKLEKNYEYGKFSTKIRKRNEKSRVFEHKETPNIKNQVAHKFHDSHFLHPHYTRR